MRQIRRPLVAYLIVMTIIGITFGLMAYNRDQDLQQQDYEFCENRRQLLITANDNSAKVKAVLRHVAPANPRIEEQVDALIPLPLPDCEHLRP